MHDLRLPFVLWLPGEAAPDLSAMSAPVRISIRLHLDQQQPEQAGQSGLPKAEDDANG
jgi:hypothetical protein